jgi:hypothetical protein
MQFANCATDSGKTHSVFTLRRDSIHNKLGREWRLYYGGLSTEHLRQKPSRHFNSVAYWSCTYIYIFYFYMRTYIRSEGIDVTILYLNDNYIVFFEILSVVS